MQPVPHDFQTICGRDQFSDFCKHDYIVSNDSNVAFVSKHTIDTYKFLVSNQKHGTYYYLLILITIDVRQDLNLSPRYIGEITFKGRGFER